MDLSMKRWKQENPAYRDDITALVVDVQKLLLLTGAHGPSGECPSSLQQRRCGAALNLRFCAGAGDAKKMKNGDHKAAKKGEGRERAPMAQAAPSHSSPMYRKHVTYKPV